MATIDYYDFTVAGTVQAFHLIPRYAFAPIYLIFNIAINLFSDRVFINTLIPNNMIYYFW